MCGVAGYAYPSGTGLDDAAMLVRMVRQLARRGPDDEGLALFAPEARSALAVRTASTVAGARIGPPPNGVSEPFETADLVTHDDLRFRHRIALGHRRFSIIDPTPAGHQPFWAADGSVCAAFNGEIYDYVELRAELEREGIRFETRSDTEVLVQAFLRWGEECFERFIGFWALALYDRRREAILLARDRMGKAPLYVARRNGRLYWASEIDALRAAVGWDAFDVRSQAVSDFVVFKLRDVHYATFFDGIESFPRGSWAWVRDDATYSPQAYWTIPSRRRTEREIPSRRAAEDLQGLLGEAVTLRLRADVPLGVELSGGLDSSAIAAVAASRGQSLRAYTVSFPGTEWDEAPFAEAVARRWDGAIEYNVIEPAHGDFFDSADDFVAHMQEPLHSPNVFTKHQIWLAMAERGLRVSLNGAAGDELFCGYPGIYLIAYLSSLLERGKLARAHREASRFVEEPARVRSKLYWLRLAKAAFHSAKRRSNALDARGAQRRSEARAKQLLSGVPPAIRERSGSIETLVAERATDWMLTYWIRLGQQNSMSVPIESRSPLLDHRLVELAFSLPVTYLIRDGWTKWILRQAVADILPDEVTFRRSKLGFPFPIQSWLAENKEKFFAAAGHVSEPCPYVDLVSLASSYDRLIGTDPDMLWRAMSVSLWWKRCVLREPLEAAVPARVLSRPR